MMFASSPINPYEKLNRMMTILFSRVIIILKNQKSFDFYADYENQIYEREKEVLVITEPLYIQSITTENDTIIIDCVNEVEHSKSYMIYI